MYKKLFENDEKEFNEFVDELLHKKIKKAFIVFNNNSSVFITNPKVSLEKNYLYLKDSHSYIKWLLSYDSGTSLYKSRNQIEIGNHKDHLYLEF